MKFHFLLFVAAVVSLTSAEVDFSEENTSGMLQTSVTPSDKQDSDEPETTEMVFRNVQSGQRNPNRFVSPDYRPLLQHKPYRGRHSGFADDAAIPHLGFSTPNSQTIYLTDHTGHYDVSLHDFRQRQPMTFQAALGAISAHILNQRHNREYIPYPPNGHPHRHPSYRGDPRAPQPPALTAYDRQTRADYDAPPPDYLPPPRPSNLLLLNQPDDYPNFLTHEPSHPAPRAPPRPRVLHR